MPTLVQGNTLGEVAEIIHAAVVLGPAAWGREPMPEAHMAADIEDKLKIQLIDLFRILQERNIQYVLVGGIAMLTFIEGRNTKDVDLVLSVESLKLLPEIVIFDQNREFARGKFGDLLVDVLLTDNPLFKIVEESHSAIHRFLEMDVRSATIEGLILLKLFALPSLYLQGQLEKSIRYEADVAILYQVTRPNMQPLFEILKPLLTEGQMSDVTSIVEDVQRRIARLDRAKRAGPDSR